MMMTSYNLAFLLGIAAGVGLTLLIAVVVLLILYVILDEEETDT